MIYIIKKDIDYIFVKNKKMFLLILLIYFTYFLLNLVLNNEIDLETFYSLSSFNIDSDSSNLDIIVFLFQLFLTIYLTINLFYADINQNLENVFLRINHNDYIFYKIISYSIINTIINSMLIFLSFLIIYIKTSININIIILILIKKILYFTLISNLTLVILLQKSTINRIILALIILLITTQKNFSNILNIELILSILLILFTLFLIKKNWRKNYVSILENIKK